MKLAAAMSIAKSIANGFEAVNPGDLPEVMQSLVDHIDELQAKLDAKHTLTSLALSAYFEGDKEKTSKYLSAACKEPTFEPRPPMALVEQAG